jgi:hypothetical protein
LLYKQDAVDDIGRFLGVDLPTTTGAPDRF